MEDGRHRQAERAEIIVDKLGVVETVHAEGRGARQADCLATGARLSDQLHSDDRDLAEMLVARVLAHGKGGTAELRWKRGEDRWSKLLTCFSPANGGRVRITLDFDDIGRLRHQEEQMRRVVEGSAQGIVVRTRDEVLYMNDSFARLLGYASHRECIENAPGIDSLIHADDVSVVLAHLHKRIRGEETISHYEFRLLHRNGTPIWVETHAANLNWNGKPASLSWINDISKRKAMEVQAQRSREAAEYANKTKTQFLANMSHELRTPLNAILGFSEMIASRMFGPIGDKYLEYAEDIHSSGRLLLDLVNDVLDLSKLEAGKLELHESDLSLTDLVEECLMLVRNRAEEGKVRLSGEMPKGLPKLRADARAVKQLLLNFLSNAVKFTPEGGEVRVTADHDMQSGLFLTVSDTGIGMTPAEIEVALSPFGQVDSKLARKHEGTGLGLPICRALMELHGGELTLTSTPQIGTSLTARFPAYRIVLARARG